MSAEEVINRPRISYLGGIKIHKRVTEKDENDTSIMAEHLSKSLTPEEFIHLSPTQSSFVGFFEVALDSKQSEAVI